MLTFMAVTDINLKRVSKVSFPIFQVFSSNALGYGGAAARGNTLAIDCWFPQFWLYPS